MPILLVHLCDLIKSHRKAHFRLNKETGKYVYVHEHELKDGKGHDLEIAPGDRMRVNNPKSKHHGKEITVTSYSTVYDCVRGKVEGSEAAADCRVHHLKHVKTTPDPILVVRRTPVPAPVAKTDDKDVKAPVRAPVAAPAAPAPAYDFKKSFDEFLADKKDLQANRWRPDADPGWVRYYFERRFRDCGFIQIRSSNGEPMLIGRKTDGLPDPGVIDFFRTLRKQYRASIGERLTLTSAFADAGLELKTYADGSYTIAGNTYPHRGVIAKYGGKWDRDYKRYSLPPVANLLALVHDLPPFYNKEDFDAEAPSITGKTTLNSAGSGAGNTRLDSDRHDDGKVHPGAPDGRRDSPSSSGRGSVVPGAAPEGSRKKIAGLETLSVEELTKLILQKGIEPPAATVKYDPKRFGAVELFSEQIEGVEQICSAFQRGQSGFLRSTKLCLPICACHHVN